MVYSCAHGGYLGLPGTELPYKPQDASLFTKILILEGDRQDVKIQFLMWELEKRCKLENDFNLPACEKKKIVRKRKRKQKDA